MSVSIAHIINPVGVSPTHPLFAIQQITFESIRHAKIFSVARNIEICSTQFEEDKSVIPSFITVLPNLCRSVLDENKFTKQRKLPLVADILNALGQHSKADYFVFTNMDIGLMPSFYESVFTEIENEHDAILITRRRIANAYHSINQLPVIYADLGKPHPGYDTFVFKRELLEKFILDKVCVGIPFLEVSLLHNLVAFSSNLKLMDRAHLTFHIGMEVMPPVDEEYYQHNRKCYETQILPKLKPLLAKEKFPYSDLSFFSRMLKWGLNPCYRTSLMLEMEGMNAKRKAKFLLDEIRWKILQGN
jgi:hypothetical protein